jgi:hypothetical protein
LPATLHQIVSVLARLLRVKQLDFQRQATHFLAYLDAERAGPVLVEGNAPTLLVDLSLMLS